MNATNSVMSNLKVLSHHFLKTCILCFLFNVDFFLAGLKGSTYSAIPPCRLQNYLGFRALCTLVGIIFEK